MKMPHGHSSRILQTAQIIRPTSVTASARPARSTRPMSAATITTTRSTGSSTSMRTTPRRAPTAASAPASLKPNRGTGGVFPRLTGDDEKNLKHKSKTNATVNRGSSVPCGWGLPGTASTRTARSTRPMSAATITTTRTTGSSTSMRTTPRRTRTATSAPATFSKFGISINCTDSSLALARNIADLGRA